MKLEFANFTCKFGIKNLSDYLENIILPAFLDGSLVREYGSNAYLIYEPEVADFGTDEHPFLVVFGQFVKDMVLTAEQRLDRNLGLIKVHDYMQSSPSAFFVLLLNTHRLLYLHLTKDAPDFKSFQTTLLNFFKTKRNELIDADYKLLQKSFKKHLWVSIRDSLNELHPMPTLKIVPLSSEATIEEFVHRYKVLKTLTVSIHDTNNELDLNEMFSQIRKAKEKSNSTTTKLIHSNPDGLSKEETIKQIQTTVEAGTGEVTLHGIDETGGRLIGINDNFNLKIDMHVPPEESRIDTVQEMIDQYLYLIESGTLKPPATEEPSLEVLRRVSGMQANVDESEQLRSLEENIEMILTEGEKVSDLVKAIGLTEEGREDDK